MQSTEIANRYFNAWQRHDATGITGSFVEGGTYEDPVTGQPLSGPAIGAYAAGLWAAFPDLAFDMVSVAPAGEGMVATQWLMRGTHRGPMNGLPPTGRPVALPGADFIRVEGDRIRSVRGYFDMKTFSTQLGLQTVVQPHAAGPFTFGTSVAVQTGKRTQPGAFSITALEVANEEGGEKVRTYSRRIGPEMLEMPGFISWVGVVIGRRLLTITAWEQPDQPRQLLRGGTHKEAMGDFYEGEGYLGGSTGVWVPARMGTMWVRCTNCGRMAGAGRNDGRCDCGQPLPEHPPYW